MNNNAFGWKSNDLLLKDPHLRSKAGVAVLDEGVHDMYQQKGAERRSDGKKRQNVVVRDAKSIFKMAKGVMTGGGAKGAPFYWQTGGFPHHYYSHGSGW